MLGVIKNGLESFQIEIIFISENDSKGDLTQDRRSCNHWASFGIILGFMYWDKKGRSFPGSEIQTFRTVWPATAMAEMTLC